MRQVSRLRPGNRYLHERVRVAETTAAIAGKAIHVWYSGKHHVFSGDIPFVSNADGFPLWVKRLIVTSAPEADPRARTNGSIVMGHLIPLPSNSAWPAR